MIRSLGLDVGDSPHLSFLINSPAAKLPSWEPAAVESWLYVTGPHKAIPLPFFSVFISLFFFFSLGQLILSTCLRHTICFLNYPVSSDFFPAGHFSSQCLGWLGLWFLERTAGFSCTPSALSPLWFREVWPSSPAILSVFRDLGLSQLRKAEEMLLSRVEARDAAKHPTAYRIGLKTKSYLVYNASSAGAEKPCPHQWHYMTSVAQTVKNPPAVQET